MATTWLFDSSSSTPYQPAIKGQILDISQTTVCLINPWVSDSVFMGKLYCAITVTLTICLYPHLFSSNAWEHLARDPLLLSGMLFSPFIFIPFLIYRIWFIKGLSSICFNRSTKKFSTSAYAKS